MDTRGPDVVSLARDESQLHNPFRETSDLERALRCAYTVRYSYRAKQASKEGRHEIGCREGERQPPGNSKDLIRAMLAQLHHKTAEKTTNTCLSLLDFYDELSTH